MRFGPSWVESVIIKNHPRWRDVMDMAILLGSSSDLPIAQVHENLGTLRRTVSAACGVSAPLAGFVEQMATPSMTVARCSSPWPVWQRRCGSPHHEARDRCALWRRVPYDSSVHRTPPGVPAATVGVDRGDNAGYLAVQMLAFPTPSTLRPLSRTNLTKLSAEGPRQGVNGGA